MPYKDSEQRKKQQKAYYDKNKAGICTYLYDRPHNHRYDVGHKRIYSLKEL